MTTTTNYEKGLMLAEECVTLSISDGHTHVSSLGKPLLGIFQVQGSATTSVPNVQHTLSGRTFTFTVRAPGNGGTATTAVSALTVDGIIKGYV